MKAKKIIKKTVKVLKTIGSKDFRKAGKADLKKIASDTWKNPDYLLTKGIKGTKKVVKKVLKKSKK